MTPPLASKWISCVSYLSSFCQNHMIDPSWAEQQKFSLNHQRSDTFSFLELVLQEHCKHGKSRNNRKWAFPFTQPSNPGLNIFGNFAFWACFCLDGPGETGFQHNCHQKQLFPASLPCSVGGQASSQLEGCNCPWQWYEATHGRSL